MTPKTRAALDDISVELIALRDLLSLCSAGLERAGGGGGEPCGDANAIGGLGVIAGQLSDRIEALLKA